jgi:predicted enzyme related to lactoylglutathione lyase
VAEVFMAIRGIHAMFFTDQAEQLRVFLRDVLQLPTTDVGHGWLINGPIGGEIGAHPVDHEGAPASGTHDVSFVCDDLEQTMAELSERGVQFTDEVSDQGYGLCVHFEMPGGVKVELYQPRYELGS